MEDAKDDLHAYLDLQQMAAAQNPQAAALHYQAQQAAKMQQYPHQGPPGFHPGQDGLGPQHHMQSPHVGQSSHQGRDGHHGSMGGHLNAAAAAAFRQGLSQPTPAESPIPASNVEVSYGGGGPSKRQRLHASGVGGFDMDEANSVSNFNLNRTVKYHNNMDHSVSLDEHGAFGLYVGEILRKLPDRLGSVTSLKVMQLLHEAQIQALDMAPAATTASGSAATGAASTSSKKDAGSPHSVAGSEERKSTESNESKE